MKKALVLGALIAVTAFTATAQLRIDVGGNYTMYRSDFNKSTPGGKIRLSLPFGGMFAGGVGFTYGSPIKIPTEMSLSGGSTVPAEMIYNFKTITLEGDIYFGEEKEEGFTAYGSGRIGFVLVSYKEKVKGSIPSGQQPLYQYDKSSTESGFTLNGSIGAQYSLGNLKLFADAGIALPANQVNGQYVENVIPTHFVFNAGVRFSLGRPDY